MPFNCAIHSDSGYASVEFSGSVTGDDIAQAARTLFLDPNWVTGFDLLIDARTVAPLFLVPDDVEQIESTLGGLGPTIGEGRTAIVADDQEDVRFSALLLKARTNTNRKVEVFVGLREALEWLTGQS